MENRAVVCGVGESPYYRRGESPYDTLQLASIAIRRAVEDAGLELCQIDGFVSYLEDPRVPTRLAEALAIDGLDFSAQTWGNGGNGVASAVAIADAAVSAGYARHVVVYRALSQSEKKRFGRARVRELAYDDSAYTAPYGLLTAAHQCAMQVRRFMHDHGIEQDALAEIALAAYAHAQRNPRALSYGRPLTREQYHASRWIAEPFHVYDCCRENDGAGAVILTTRERARDLRRTPVGILAAAQGLDRKEAGGLFNEQAFPTANYARVGRTLWSRAGVTPEDVDVAQFYENFSGSVLMAISEMGFCRPEDVGSFVSKGNLHWPEGGLPTNTSGGNLAEAYIHGFGGVLEAARQIRGESTCQVAGAQLSLFVAAPSFAPGSALLFSGL